METTISKPSSVQIKNEKGEVFAIKVELNKSMIITGVVPSKFKEDDAGRSESKRSKQRNDCTVRALALAAEIDYDEAYDFLAKMGRKSGRGFHLQKYLNVCAKKGTTVFGKRIIKYSFPAVKGMERMYVGAFCMLYPEGRFILRQAGHVSAVIAGHVHDTDYNCFRCVYNAYEFK